MILISPLRETTSAKIKSDYLAKIDSSICFSPPPPSAYPQADFTLTIHNGMLRHSLGRQVIYISLQTYIVPILV